LNEVLFQAALNSEFADNGPLFWDSAPQKLLFDERYIPTIMKKFPTTAFKKYGKEMCIWNTFRFSSTLCGGDMGASTILFNIFQCKFDDFV
jgi:hypothetical protein